MKYPELEETCKNCGGCMRLENENFIGDRDCKYKEKETYLVSVDKSKFEFKKLKGNNK